MAAWIGWLVLAVVLAAFELTGTGFVMLGLAAAAVLTAAITAIAEPTVATQLQIAAGATVVLAPAAAWYHRWLLHRRPPGPLAAGRLKNVVALVADDGRRLTVEVQGERLPVRHADGGELRAGQRVRVLRIEGITAVARPVGKEADT